MFVLEASEILTKSYGRTTRSFELFDKKSGFLKPFLTKH